MGAKLKELLKSGKLVKVFCLGQLCHPKLVELVGLQGGFDAVWFDQEHVGLTLQQIEEAARAARAAGLDSFVRLAPTDYATVMRPLEAGAGGVMAAQVRSAREAANVVKWARFYPLGMRGINSTGFDGRYGSMQMRDYFRHADAESFVAIQIEHIDAVEDVEQIAALPGIDLLFIGPADLSQSMGIPAEWSHPRLWQAFERVAAASKAHNVPWAILPFDTESARRCVQLGCRMLSIGIDMWVMQRGVKAFKAEFAEFF